MANDQKLRGKRPKKRKFLGNQHTKAVEQPAMKKPVVAVENPQFESTSKSSCATPTTCEKKITTLKTDLEQKQDADKYSDCEEFDSSEVSVPHSNRIIDMDILGANVSESVVCRFCKKPVQLVETDRQGLGSMLTFNCGNKRCQTKQKPFPTCSLTPANNLTIQ